MAYPMYDGLSRPMSHMGYGAAHLPFPVQATYSNYPQTSYQIYGPRPPSTTIPVSRRLTGPSYDDLDVHDGYLPDEPLAMMPRSRSRRRSTVSFSSRPMDPYYLPSSLRVKFKRKRSFSAGISLAEAQDRVRLSNNDAYTIYDFHADSRNRILLRINWAGYSSMTYEIPLDAYDGRISLQTLARRVSRACVHYLQANVIPIVWDHVYLHYLEEISYGMWQPTLSAR